MNIRFTSEADVDIIEIEEDYLKEGAHLPGMITS